MDMRGRSARLSLIVGMMSLLISCWIRIGERTGSIVAIDGFQEAAISSEEVISITKGGGLKVQA